METFFRNLREFKGVSVVDMRTPTITLTTTICLTSAASLSAKDTPVQPWSGYHVHDEKRPHPEKVETKGAVTTPAPKDAIVLFGGTSTDKFDKAWTVKDGIMIASKVGNIRTKDQFGDCQIHLEWRIPAGRAVSGQKGGDSGIFIMDKYEVQIQESHTNVTYADGQAGALYGQYPPLKNASTPHGEWQSYDIIFKAPRYNEKGLVSPAVITVIHNGVTVHNAQELLGPTVHKRLAQYPKTLPAKAPIRLQWHSDPIEYRNFWVRPLGTQEDQKKK